MHRIKNPRSKESAPDLSDESLKNVSGRLNALDKKSALVQEISAANAEIERIKAWGDFSG